MVPFIKENGIKIVFEMGKGNAFLLMEITMMAIGLMENLLSSEDSFIVMGLFMKELLEKENEMGKGC